MEKKVSVVAPERLVEERERESLSGKCSAVLDRRSAGCLSLSSFFN